MTIRRDQTYLRTTNKSLILRLLQAKGSLTRVDICRSLGLSPPTASSLVAELQEQGWLIEIGVGKSRGGRQPLIYGLNPKAGYAVGIDLGITWIRTSVIDFTGRTLATSRIPTPQVDYENLLKVMVSEAMGVVSEAGLKTSDLCGAGFGLHGLVDSEEGKVRFAPHFHWIDKPAARDLSEVMGLFVKVDNDVRAMARGEYLYGAAKGVSDFVTVNVGSGVGSAVFINHQFVTGAATGAGEIGHMVVDDEGVHCECGNYGCMTVMADGASIARQAARRIKQGERSLLNDMVDGHLSQVKGELIHEAAKKGDPLAVRVLKDAGRYVGIALANIINLLNPPLIILGGGVCDSGEVFWESMLHAASTRSLEACFRVVKIEKPALGEWAGSIGAASMAFERVFGGYVNEHGSKVPGTREVV